MLYILGAGWFGSLLKKQLEILDKKLWLLSYIFVLAREESL